MEIRNNTPMMQAPSFGMAFKKPSPELMEDFVEYVGKGKSGRAIKRGLEQLQEQQAGNKHFDIVTLKQGDDIVFKVAPKIEAEKARKMYPNGEIFERSQESYSPITKAMKKNSAARAALGENPSKVKKALVETGCFFRELLGEIKALRNPVNELPANLQDAATKATKLEKQVDWKIKKDETIRSAFQP